MKAIEIIMTRLKWIAVAFLIIGFSTAVFAVPRSLYLASPQKIEVSGNKVKLFFELPCKNDFPDEWAGNLVAVSDDEGDMVIALGVVLNKDSCKPGPQKTFTFSYDLMETGVSGEDLKNGTTFEPIILAR